MKNEKIPGIDKICEEFLQNHCKYIIKGKFDFHVDDDEKKSVKTKWRRTKKEPKKLSKLKAAIYKEWTEAFGCFKYMSVDLDLRKQVATNLDEWLQQSLQFNITSTFGKIKNDLTKQIKKMNKDINDVDENKEEHKGSDFEIERNKTEMNNGMSNSSNAKNSINKDVNVTTESTIHNTTANEIHNMELQNGDEKDDEKDNATNGGSPSSPGDDTDLFHNPSIASVSLDIRDALMQANGDMSNKDSEEADPATWIDMLYIFVVETLSVADLVTDFVILIDFLHGL